jgi:hypothetical protein
MHPAKVQQLYADYVRGTTILLTPDIRVALPEIICAGVRAPGGKYSRDAVLGEPDETDA